MKCIFFTGLAWCLAVSSVLAAPATPPTAWEQLGHYSLSPDGRWFACPVVLEDGSRSRVLLGNLDGKHAWTAEGAREAFLSPNSKTCALAFETNGGPALSIRDLESATTLVTFERPRMMDVSPEMSHPRFLLVQGAQAVTGPMAGGNAYHPSDLLLCSLASSKLLVIPDVRTMERAKWRDRLAVVVGADSGGAHLRVLDLTPEGPKLLFEREWTFDRAVWSPDATGLACLHGRRLLFITGLGGASPAAREEALAAEPGDVSMSDDSCLVASQGGALTLFTPSTKDESVRAELDSSKSLPAGTSPHKVAIDYAGADTVLFHASAAAPASAAGSGQAGEAAPAQAVEVWRGSDVLTYPEAKPAPRPLFCWRPHDGTVTELDSGLLSEVRILPDHRHALLIDGKPHARQRSRGYDEVTCFDLDLTSGKRHKIGDVIRVKFTFPLQISPNGRSIAYFESGNWWLYDVSSQRHTNLTATIQSKFSADPLLSDVSDAPCALIEWVGNEKLVAYDDYDAWLLRASGDKDPRRLTGGHESGRRYRRELAPEADAAGQARLFLSVFDFRSKASGFAVADEQGHVSEFGFGEWACSDLREAANAECFVWTRQRYDEPPNLYCASPSDPDRPLTSINVSKVPFPWARRQLLQYTSPSGLVLQAALAYPSDYQPGKRYPMVVRIHTREADEFFQFGRPDSSPFSESLSTYAQRGYFALWPNIYRRPMDVGGSTVECVEAGVRAALATGMIDEQRVLLMGHSHGGYGTAFVLCKSKLFRAGVAASMISDWTTDAVFPRAGMASISAEKYLCMPEPFWENPEAYRANSVLYNATGITSPLLIVHGKKDDVDNWHESEQLYQVLRYLNKPVTMLVYPESGHNFGGPDYDRRVWQFVDHHLKGTPSEAWMDDIAAVPARDR